MQEIKVGYLRENISTVSGVFFFFRNTTENVQLKKLVIFQSWTESREALQTRTHIHVTGWETFRKTGYEK